MKRKFRNLGVAVVFTFAWMFSLVLPCSAEQKVEVINEGNQLIVEINGEQINCDPQPYIASGYTMVPVSVIAKQLGATVDWDSATMTVNIKGPRAVVLTIGSATATIDGSPISLQAPATITGGRTMVPLRFISEALGIEVVYTQLGDTVSPKSALDIKVEDIIAKTIKPNMQDLDKAFALYNYVVNNSLYGWGPHAGSAYGNLIDGVSVCAGYADAIHVLYEATGIDCYSVSGNFGSARHAWNIFKTDNKYYHVDGVQKFFSMMNDTEAKKRGYNWDEKAYPKCEGSFNIPRRISGYWVNNGYIYYPSDYMNIKNWLEVSLGTQKNIYKIKPDGSENTKVFTTGHPATEFVRYDDWVYYYDSDTQQGVYKAHFDGSDDTKVTDHGDIGRIYISNGYLFIEHKAPVKKHKIDIILHRVNLETKQEDEIIVEQGLDQMLYLEGIGEYIYYIKPENGIEKYYRMTLDGKQKILILDVDPKTKAPISR